MRGLKEILECCIVENYSFKIGAFLISIQINLRLMDKRVQTFPREYLAFADAFPPTHRVLVLPFCEEKAFLCLENIRGV